MKSHDSELYNLVRDSVGTGKILKRLSAKPTANPSPSVLRLPRIYHAWVEEQIVSFVKLSAPVVVTKVPDASEDIAKVNADGLLPPTPTPELIPKPDSGEQLISNEDSLGNLRGLSIGGVMIGVKQKQQKKRMKPVVMTDKINVNYVQGNINSVDSTKELVDIRAELKQVTAQIPLPYSGDSRNPARGSTTNSSSEAVFKPVEVISTIPTCSICSKYEDSSSVQRMASIYATLVANQHISIFKALGLVHTLVTMDPLTAADVVVCGCVSVQGSVGSNSHGTLGTSNFLLRTCNNMRIFLRSLLDSLLSVIVSCGAVIANEIADAATVRVWAPELSVRIKEMLNVHFSGTTTSLPGFCSNSTSFRLPETFMKPFREDVDSKNEFKTQEELGTFYERERVYDDFSNLYFRFQVTNRSDLDGSAVAQFYRTDLASTGSTQFLFYGTTTTHAIVQLKTKSEKEGGNSQEQYPVSAVSTPSVHNTHNNKSYVSKVSGGPSSVLSNSANGAGGVGVGVGNTVTPGSQSQKFGNESRSLPLDSAKHNKLEARLGMGGEVKPSGFTPSSSVIKFATPTTASTTAHNSSGGGGGGGVHKRGGSGRRQSPFLGSGLTAVPSVSRAALDIYEAPSSLFGGPLQFFFRFIVGMNNHRFNQSLCTCILAEITTLMKSNDFSSTGVAVGMSFPVDSDPVNLFSSDTVLHRSLADRDYLLSPETFALKVTKLKILGRFLGLLQFYHQWVAISTTLIEHSPLQKLSADLASRRGMLQVLLPLRKALDEARMERRLSMCVPWVCEFLKMEMWDPACVEVVRNPASNRLQTIPYFDVFEYLRSLQYSSDFFPMSQNLSTNRMFVGVEIQALWQFFPAPLANSLMMIPVPELPRRVLAESRDLTPSIYHMIDSVGGNDHPTVNHHLSSTESGLDDQSLAFTLMFLHHVVPPWEKIATSLRLHRTGGPDGKSLALRSRTLSVGGTKRIKRQTPSLMTPESIALREALQNPVSPPDAAPNTSASLSLSHQLEPLAVVPPHPPGLSAVHTAFPVTPTKVRRSTSTGTEGSKAVKTPRKKSITPNSLMDESFRSPSKSKAISDRMRTPSFESLSPSQNLGSPQTTGESKQLAFGGSCSRPNSIASGRSSPAGTIMGSRSHRSYSDLNNSYSLRFPGSGSPTKGGGLSGGAGGSTLLSPLKIGETGQSFQDNSDVLERLEIAFWNQHNTLQEMSYNLLGHASAACLAHNKERVGLAVRELVSHCANLRSESDCGRFKDQLESYMKRTLNSAVSEGEVFIEGYFSKFIATTLPEMLQLYPINNRVLRMALYFMNRHFHAQRAPLVAQLRDYCSRKLNEVCLLSTKQHGKQLAEPSAKVHSTTDIATVESVKEPSTCTQEFGNSIEFSLLGVEPSRILHICNTCFEDISGINSLTLEGNLQFLTHTCELSVNSAAIDATNHVSLRNSAAQLLVTTADFVILAAQCAGAVQQVKAFAHCNIGTTFWLVGREAFPVVSSQEDSKKSEKLSVNFESIFQNVVNMGRISIQEIKVSLKRVSVGNPIAQISELHGKIKADVAKFLTAVTPNLLYLDYMSEQLNYSIFPSDILLVILNEDLVSLEMLCRVLTITARVKTAAYYENCKRLLGMQDVLTKLILSFVGRLLGSVHRDKWGEEILSATDGDVWYEDFSRRQQVKSSVGEPLSSLITNLLAGLRS